jgi:hypothetical protein
MTGSICGHKKRREIDRALLERRPLRRTASQFGTSTGSLQRHRAHIHRDLVEAHQSASRVEQFARADFLLADVRNAEDRAERLYGAAEGILERALEAEDLKTALNAIRAAVDVMAEARQYLELRGELTGELPHAADSTGNVTLIRVLSVPRMPGVEDAYDALEPPPSARQVVEPAAEPTEAKRSPSVAAESLGIPSRNRR